MKRKTLSKITAALLTAVLLAGMFDGLHITAYADGEADNASTSFASVSVEDSSLERFTTNYTNVSKNFKAKEYTGAPVKFKSSDASNVSDVYGYDSQVAKLKCGDELSITIDVPTTALYYIGFDYYSTDSSILPIEFSLKIDGEYEFYELRSLSFETTWETSDAVSIDRYGNETVTLPVKKACWEFKNATDGSYRYSAPFKIELSEGTHELEILVNEGSFLLGDVTLSAPEIIPDYRKEDDSLKASGNEIVIIQAEDFYERNDSSIHAVGEFDASVDPLSSTTTVLNVVDSDSFAKAGQCISYEFKVSKSGYYNIGLNYRQTDKNDFPVFADIRIDGKIPNTAYEAYPLAYTTKYVTSALTDSEGNNLTYYLEAGIHTISFTISVDPLRYVLEEVDVIMNGINDLSLEVTKVAGSDKVNNKYRDLKLTRYIPDIQEKLDGWIASLYELSDYACNFVDVKSGDDVAAFAYLRIAAKQLESLAKDPNELIYRVGELATSSNSINTQIANFIDIIGKNNLSIDRIYFYQDDASLPKGIGIFKKAAMSVKRFVYSFTGQAYSAANVNKDHIQVWVNRPRTYVEIMQKMVDEEFTPKTGIGVDLCIMTDAQKLILSNASGDTPDICTGINYSIPFEIGIRGALVDLTKFDDYREIFGRYSEGLILSCVIDDGFIALPETMNYYLTFYRTDIFNKLGLTVPDTMDELIAMLPDLQMRGLNVYYPTAPMQAMRNFHGTTPLIFQNGGSLYGETALDLQLGSEEVIKGFTELTELFTIYNLPVDVPNFYQHFRNGDLPLGIADFNSYNLILNAAPEIASSWDIALVPGTVDPKTGEVMRYMSGGAESTVMFKSDDEREAKAWEFMKWWSSTEIQAEFGQMLQIMYGDEYIWPTANLEAFNLLPFPTAHKETIIEQASYMMEAPRLLGSYMLEREMSNAFNSIVVDAEILRTRMDAAVKVVNRETARKLEEFGYIDSDGNVIKDYIVPSVEVVRKILEK